MEDIPDAGEEMNGPDAAGQPSCGVELVGRPDPGRTSRSRGSAGPRSRRAKKDRRAHRRDRGQEPSKVRSGKVTP